MKQYVFKCFQTKGGNYVYDRSTNSLISVTSDEYDEMKKLYDGELQPDSCKALRRYQEHGMFWENSVERLSHPETNYLQYHLNHRMQQLILQVTQQCNLRCEYCIYSGLYHTNRQHNSKNMTFETARKAIDYFMQRNDDTDRIAVSFYGGEPLLRFDLVKQCVSYIENTVNGHTVLLNMTTNGTLLSPEVTDYLVAHDFHLAISLDGPRDMHNVNRKFRNGEGSFDRIMENVHNIKELYPDFAKNIMFMTVVNPKADLDQVVEFFETDELLHDNHIRFNYMSEVGLDTQLDYAENYRLLRNYEYLKMLASLINKVEKENISQLMTAGEQMIRMFAKKLRTRAPLPSVFQRGGPCLAGIRRLFVTVDGNLFPCERVNETSDFCKLGTLSEGIEEKKVSDFINIGSITEEECKDCWNLPFCLMCFGEIDVENKDYPSPNDILANCQSQKIRTLRDLYEYATLSELGYNAIR